MFQSYIDGIFFLSIKSPETMKLIHARQVKINATKSDVRLFLFSFISLIYKLVTWHIDHRCDCNNLTIDCQGVSEQWWETNKQPDEFVCLSDVVTTTTLHIDQHQRNLEFVYIKQFSFRCCCRCWMPTSFARTQITNKDYNGTSQDNLSCHLYS